MRNPSVGFCALVTPSAHANARGEDGPIRIAESASFDPTVADEATPPTSMSSETVETNREVVEQLIELIENGEIDRLDEVIDENVTMYYSGGDEVSGLDTYKEFTESWVDGFSDLSFDVHDMVAEDDTVIVYMTMQGTHDGEFQGIEATGNSFEETGFNLLRLSDGKIVEDVNVLDTYSFAEQLGIDPDEF